MSHVICLTATDGSMLKVDFDTVTGKKPISFPVSPSDDTVVKLNGKIRAADPWNHREYRYYDDGCCNEDVHPISQTRDEFILTRRQEKFTAPSAIALNGTFLTTSLKRHFEERTAPDDLVFDAAGVFAIPGRRYPACDVPINHTVVETVDEIETALKNGVDNLHDSIGAPRRRKAEAEITQKLSNAADHLIYWLQAKGDASWSERISAFLRSYPADGPT